MDEEQHNVPFSADGDFENLVEIGGEWFASGRRKRRQQTKEEALYGYQSSDDDSDGGRGRGRGGKRPKADYTKPVGFVSSGVIVQQPDGSTAEQKKPAKQQQQQQQQQTQQQGAEERPAGAGLGFGGGSGGGGGGLGFTSGGSSGGGGLGFKSGGVQQGSTAAPGSGGGGGMLRHTQQQQQQQEEDAADEEEAVLPTAFGKRIKAAAERKVKQRHSEAAAVAQRSAARAADPKFATFEAHTKGIGLKLLSKMGFTPGQGLGRDKQGIAKPLEPKLRPKGMGMGFGDFKEAKMVMPGAAEEAPPGPSEEEAAELAGELAAATAKTQAALWKRKAAPARQRRTYKTAEEVLAEAADGGAGGLTAQPILDLRGPQARLVTNLEQLNAAAGDGPGAAGGPSGPPMPELAHNMGLLVSLTEAQLRRLDAALQHQQDTATLLGQEKERLAREASAAAAAAERLAGLTARLEAVQRGDAGVSLQQLHDAYAGMAAAWPEEYVMYCLPAAALAQVLPRMRSVLAGWQPLSEPARGTAEFKAWRGLLEGAAARQAVLQGSWEESGDAYATLVASLLLPPIRSAITGWEPRQPEPLLAWFDAWSPLLPRGAAQQLLTGLVLPRISSAVQAWDPTREATPIHAWLHPWLPYLAAELASVYPTIRHRLSRALTAWHASDGSARILLAPWASVFEAADWEALLQRSITPKLAQALQTELVLNPLAPQLEPLAWALSWHGLLPLGQLAGLLEAAFFPAWLALLHHWLSHSPDYDEVTRWYLDWKGRLPQDLLDHPRVRRCFGAALDLMNAAADGRPLPQPGAPAAPDAPARSVPSWRTEAEDAPPGAAGPPPGAAPARAAAAAGAGEPSLRELVARYAGEQGVEFMPRAGRLHDGLPVYTFGGVSCVVDAARGVLRAQLRERGWVPVSLERLLQEARAKGGGGGGA